ncbi:S41 family peptidase [Kitasatospora sp. NBC_01246]|uniref:S41 family peptidase n=1 Tax=Kitasatospora sp. NBC_01246 TaxID=2903570 RepID=UPI002E330563|nr:S41 family peptidase [Kitasatospora sp. NBC_01246]
MPETPRRARQVVTLSLVFGAVLLAGAATGAWGDPAAPHPRPSGDAAPAAVATVGAGQDPAGAALSEQQAEHLIGATGDRWGAYYSAREYAEFSQGLDGRYLGVGLSVGRGQDGVTTVSQVLPAGPAAAAGIAVGDRLLTIDADQADRLPVTEVVARLRGREGERQAGSEVTLTVRRGDGEVREVRLRRALLDSQQVAVERLDKGVVRITVRAFTSGVAEQVRAAVHGAHGVVLDLRGNSGGLVEEAAGTAAVFLDGGPVGSYQERGGTRELTAPPGGDQRTPLVVLVDGGTMSAAELLTGALQDRSRAVVVGGRTFGKGTVQQPSRLADGAVLELTVGRYYTPAGRSPEGVGLVPDVPASGAEDAGALALRVLAGLGTRT